MKIYEIHGKHNRKFIEKVLGRIKPKPEAMKVIRYLKQRRYSLCLISGAADFFVQAIAKKLGIKKFYASSSLEFDVKGMLKTIHWRTDQGRIKLKQLRALTKQMGLDIKSEVIFVGDSENDIEVFKATCHGIAVHSESKAVKKAAWRAIDSLEQIKKIL